MAKTTTHTSAVRSTSNTPIPFAAVPRAALPPLLRPASLGCQGRLSGTWLCTRS